MRKTESTSNRVHPHAGLAIALAILCFATAAPAQTIEYDVTIIPRPAEAWNSVPTSINNGGAVVGWAQFSDPPPYLAGWLWSESGGIELLPSPPGDMFDRYGAHDINNEGVIVGDGGGDSGVAWKLAQGAYTILGTLPFDPYNASVGAAINDFDVIVGSAFDAAHFTVPRRAFMYTDTTGLEDLFPDLGRSAAVDINDAGQVVVSAGGGTFRMEPDGTRTVLPVPDGFDGVHGAVINENGDVAGVVSCPHECNQAFLYTEDRGLRVIPSVGTRHSVSGVNNSRQVVGGVTEGVSRGWIWTEQEGIRFLTTLIDPGLTLLVVDALGLNERGQIVALGYDYSEPFDFWRVILLTPVDSGIPGDIDGDGDVDLQDLATLLAAYGTCEGDARFNPDADLDSSGCVDLPDLATLLANYGSAP